MENNKYVNLDINLLSVAYRTNSNNNLTEGEFHEMPTDTYVARLYEEGDDFSNHQSTNYIDIIIGEPVLLDLLIKKYQRDKDVMTSLLNFKANGYKTVVISIYGNVVGVKPHQNIICKNIYELIAILNTISDTQLCQIFDEDVEFDFNSFLESTVQKNTTKPIVFKKRRR